MSATSFSPKFVRARIQFKMDGVVYQAGEHLINSSGVPGFPWLDFDPLSSLGKRAQLTLQILTKQPWELYCEGLVSCEQSAGPHPLALGFSLVLPPESRQKLDEAVTAEGVHPDYVRKFPRIHYLSQVSIFPSRAIVRFFASHEDIAVACDVENVSPSGFQVYSEDGRAELLRPDETVRVSLQPRGSWLRAIHSNAVVKRIHHTVDPATGNVRRYIGLSITTMAADSKINFADLLRQIVLKMKK